MENSNSNNKDDIEGLDDSEIEDLSAYPLDDVMVRKETRTVAEVVKRIEKGRYLMSPDFQRDFLWTSEKQSKLIESCLMRIPLPVFYVAEGADGRVAVVDGLQRLTSFVRYINNNFKLTGLRKEHPLQGKFFKDLPVNLQERIEDTQLTLYILDKNAPEVARLDIFERVNGGVPLTRQQMRNAIYNGPATILLQDLSKNSQFLKTTGHGLNSKTMRDREAINRFVAFYSLGWNQYGNGDMDEFLGESLKKVNQDDEVTIKKLSEDFVRSMKANYDMFGRHAFRKSMFYGEVIQGV